MSGPEHDEGDGAEAPPPPSGGEAAAPADPGPAFRLRGDPPRVMRLSRKALLVLGTTSAVGIGGALIYALSPHHGRGAPTELYNTDSRNTADQLATVPKDYGQAPKLGPPLPGDLGRPIVAAQASGKDVTTPPIGPGAGAPPPQTPQQAAAEQARQRTEQVGEAARDSKLFASAATAQPGAATGLVTTPTVAAVAGTSQDAAEPANVAQNLQSAKKAFLAQPADKRTTSPDRVAAPDSPNVVQAGSVIAAALITGLRSDLPGEITAQVTENVYDSPTGHTLLIPQGSRLVGEYDSQVAFGQERVLLAWTRLILPDGRSLVLERQPGADAAGYAGLQDQVDNHWGKLFKAAILSTFLSVGAEAGTSQNENNLAQAIRSGAANSLSQVGQEVVSRELNIQPTLTVRPGFPVRVMVTHDLVVEPWRG